MSRHLFAALCLFAGCADPDEECDGPDPELLPKAMDFADRDTKIVLLRNEGCGDPLIITRVCIFAGGDESAYFFEGPDRQEVPPGQDSAIRVTYRPEAAADAVDEAMLIIESPDRPAFTVSLCAKGDCDPETAKSCGS